MNGWAREDEGQPGLGYIIFRRRRRQGDGPDGQEHAGPDARLKTMMKRFCQSVGDGDAVFFVLWQVAGGRVFPICRRRARPPGRGTRPYRAQRLPILLDRRLPDVRTQRAERRNRVQPQPVLHAPGRHRGAGNPATRSGCWRFSTTSFATASNWRAGPFGTTCPRSWYKAFDIAGFSEGGGGGASFPGCSRLSSYGAPPHGGHRPRYRSHRHDAGGRAQHSRGHPASP